MKAGEYVVEVRSVEGVVFTGSLNVAAVVAQSQEPVCVAIDDAHVPQVMTTLSVMMGAAESRFWQQQDRIGETVRREQEALAALSADQPGTENGEPRTTDEGGAA